MEFELAIRGDLEQWAERNTMALKQALKDGVDEESRDVQLQLRADVVDAGLGQALANAWRRDLYPPGGKLSSDPAAFIYSNAAHIIAGHSETVTIGPNKAQAIAIPIPDSPVSKIKQRPGTKLTQLAAARFGPLRVVVTKRGLAMLVADMVASRNPDKRTGRQQLRRLKPEKLGEGQKPVQNRVTVPLFWLVRSLRLEKRLDPRGIATKAQAGFTNGVVMRLEQRLAAAAAQGIPE